MLQKSGYGGIIYNNFRMFPVKIYVFGTQQNHCFESY